MKNKVIWITGASSGIGEALTYLLSKQQAKLIISSRNRDKLFRVKQNCSGNQLDIHVVPLDLEKTETLAQKAREVAGIYGWVDLIIHAGGVSQRALALDTSLQVAQKIMNINFWGTVALTQALLPGMIQRGSGDIVVISSLVGKFGTKLRSAYAASKHALHGYFESLRFEVQDKNIQITIACPGFIRTRLSYNALLGDGTPQDKMDDAQEHGMGADECARQILEALVARKNEVFIGGKERFGVLLKRFFPGYFSKMMQKAKVT